MGSTVCATVEAIGIGRIGQDTGLPKVLVEAKLSWGAADDLVAAAHGKLPRGRNELRVKDLDLGTTVPGAEELVIAKRDSLGTLTLVLPDGALVPEGSRVVLHFGGVERARLAERSVASRVFSRGLGGSPPNVRLALELVPDDIAPPVRSKPDGRIALGVATAAALHIVVMGFLSAGRAPAGMDDEDARATMQRILASAEERATAELARAEEEAAKAKLEAPAPEAAAARKGKEGTAGNPARTEDGSRARDARGEARHASTGETTPTQAARERREEIETFGMLALLSGGAPIRGGTSPWATETGPSAMGNIFGTTIHDAAGASGLGLSNAGDGAGGIADVVPLGAIGTIGKVGGNGTGRGFGCCGGRLPERRPHVARWGFRFDDGAMSINGRLPPEAIQRIVRQSFGRLRACYMTSLSRDPGLEGRIAVQFVVDREGAVPFAAAKENSTNDAALAACVVKVYQAMSFPQPTGGIVTVVYPVVFTRSEP